MKNLLLLLLAAILVASCTNPNEKKATMKNLLVGTYTGDGATASQGIYLSEDESRSVHSVLLAESTNPSWLAYNNSANKLYAVEEVREGKIHVFQFEKGKAKRVQSVPSMGASPCHLSLSPNGKYLAVANYMGGNIALYRLDNAGAIEGEAQVKQHEGSGPNKSRQEAAHAHWVGWDKSMQYLYVVDLGIDRLMAYPFDEKTGALGEGIVALQLAPGSGPRHMYFHPNKNSAYIVNELHNTLIHAEVGEHGRLQTKNIVPLLPQDFSGHSQAAHIAMQGEYLYVSNRGHDSIVVFSLLDDGAPQLVQWQSTQGHWPRHFSFSSDGGTLWVANEQDDKIVAFSVEEDGGLSAVSEPLQISKPTFVSSY
ncbi:6-phosphogluconolactonase [Alteromonadaceae bacterium Bs31]|nr:6-phosphogluconolactonase [Alteromonadaceae bacterium Bs31]